MSKIKNDPENYITRAKLTSSPKKSNVYSNGKDKYIDIGNPNGYMKRVKVSENG